MAHEAVTQDNPQLGEADEVLGTDEMLSPEQRLDLIVEILADILTQPAESEQR